ncbi:FAD-dependent oxidoreductase, partial [Microcoleus sp. HI-ES]|nr:FAD-dependent oxidoreductase [Microcoleus sp. HI-ES]MCZ0904281.1 FAD-dependent oxidoreductase [Microcoleus sp. HI-ES]
MLSTFKKLASIAIIFAALKLLLNYPPFTEIENYIANRDPASATLDNGNLQQKSSSPPPVTPKKSPEQPFDVVVYGDEVPGICAAIWAKKTLG